MTSLDSTGTFAWAAPELLLGRRCTERVDIYSFGVVLWEIVTGERPMRGQTRALRCCSTVNLNRRTVTLSLIFE